MPATGNNRHAEITLSIRLSADGLIFYSPMGDVPTGEFVAGPTESTRDLLEKLRLTERVDFNAFASAVVEVDTDRLVLVPLEAFEEGMQEHYLAMNNIPLTPHDAVVVATAAPAILAIMLLPRDVIEFCHGIWGEHNVRFASPISHCLSHGLHEAARIYLARDFAYVSLYGDKLQAARAIPCRSTADLLYQMLPMPLRRTQIQVMGRGAKNVAAELRRYYRRVRSIQEPFHAHR